ncbi:MAG: 2,3,4,5-tetrahydropyridine-2,6-dicarboxylate N-succinyltransferase [Gammaproteobacteria bacterium TMED92]|nr:MAG: 2,3,4,5-tetrahydropyridine-2,6-dicarboxylate N-succinyltransferase [Gammaproteobacteria bacterium TMED92]
MTDTFAFGLGFSRQSASGAMLDCYFPRPLLSPQGALLDALAGLPHGAHEVDVEFARVLDAAQDGGLVAGAITPATTQHSLIAVRLDNDQPINSTAEAYLKLHLLSHRLCVPNSLNLDGIFAHLPNVAWTSEGPVAVDELTDAIARAHLNGRQLEVFAVDKFPKMVNYVVPTGVRIADASRIRLGAYLGDGTTVMHEGFVNFNAGAMGPNMVEGRISQGVTVGAGTDLGGSASTMGTLSGGGNITISIGENCLIGANAGTGIPLGDRCTIEAGLYITAGMKIQLFDEHGDSLGEVKARTLAGKSDMLFMRDSQVGNIICRTNRQAIELNDQLHQHN